MSDEITSLGGQCLIELTPEGVTASMVVFESSSRVTK